MTSEKFQRHHAALQETVEKFLRLFQLCNASSPDLYLQRPFEPPDADEPAECAVTEYGEGRKKLEDVGSVSEMKVHRNEIIK